MAVRHRAPVSLSLIKQQCKHWKDGGNSYKNSVFIYLHKLFAKMIKIYLYFQLLLGLAAVLQQVVNYKDLCVVWDENYPRDSLFVKRILSRPRYVFFSYGGDINDIYI